MKDKQMKIQEVETTKKGKKKRKIFRKIFLLLLIVLICVGGYFGYKTMKNGGGLKGMLAALFGQDIEKVENLDRIDFILLGQSGGLTDSIIVCSYDPKTQEAVMLSIPRDTFIGKNKNKATGYDKINSLYSDKNPEKLINAVNDITGLNIQYYILIDTKALIKLVDEIGGVTFNVPINMNYDDSTQNLHIHLKAGEQLIDGAKAEQLLRFRHNNNGSSYSTEYGDNDYGRMRTQREFIAVALKQTLKAENILKIGSLLDIVKENVKTNIDFEIAKKYIPFAVEFNTENIKTGMLPGKSELTNGVWVYIYDKEKTEEMINELFFNSEQEDENEEKGESTSETKKQEVSNVKIEILNGSSKTNILSKIAEDMKSAGFNVIKTGSTTKTTKTMIVNYTNQSSEICNMIKQALGAGNISNSTTSNSSLDITVIIGEDYK